MTTKKIIAQVHLWLGLASGLVVFILGITGAIYAFSDEIKSVVYYDRLNVEVPRNQHKLSLDVLLPIAEQAIGEGHKISRAQLPQDPSGSYMFRALKVNKGAFGYWNYYEYFYKVYLNPYTGEVVHKENAKFEFFTVVLALHMNLLLGDVIGHFVVRWSVVCFVLLLISGLVLWWPKKWKGKQLKNSFQVKWNAKFKRLNYDLHNVLGFYTFLLLLIISLTGLVWSFGINTDKKFKVLSDTSGTMGKIPADNILQQALKSSPESAYFLYNFPVAKSGTVNVSAYRSNVQFYNRLQYRFDRYNGKMLYTGIEFKDLGAGAKLIALNYDLHTGSALGIFGKFLAFLCGLIAASLPLTGLLIWLKPKKRKVNGRYIAVQNKAS